MQRGLSNKAAGKVGPRHAAKRLSLTPKQVKHRWQQLEKNINKVAISKQTIASMERDMERHLQQREELGKSLDQLLKRRDHSLINRHDPSVIRDLEDQIETLRANIDYVQESIAESQQNIMQIEESKERMENCGSEDSDARTSLIWIPKYLVEKLYNKNYQPKAILMHRKKPCNKGAGGQALMSSCRKPQHKEQLLQHLLSQQDTWNGNVRPVDLCSSHKIRRRTALPEELLYPIISSTTQERLTITELPSGSQEEVSDSMLMPPPHGNPIVRVPSAPGSLNIPTRKVYDRQESTSPRLTRRAMNMPQSSLLGKPGSIHVIVKCCNDLNVSSDLTTRDTLISLFFIFVWLQC
ncbi:hypothetical protein L9F63_009470, partial [Diploptera punctata]